MRFLVLLPFWEYTSKMLATISEVYDKGNVCYVSLNKPLLALKPVIMESHMDFSRFRIVDAVTHSVVPNAPAQDNCIYVSSPSALDEIQQTLAEALAKEKFSLVVFDSITTLLIFLKEEESLSYLKKIGDTADMFGCEVLFTALEENMNKNYRTRLNYIIDKTIDMTPEDDRTQN